MEFSLSMIKKEHNKEIYGILNVLGDLGGVQGIIYVIIIALFSPISEYSFNM